MLAYAGGRLVGKRRSGRRGPSTSRHRTGRCAGGRLFLRLLERWVVRWVEVSGTGLKGLKAVRESEGSLASQKS